MASKITKVSSFIRTKQWEVFSRLWYVFDAKWQNPFESAVPVAKVLLGKHKPIYHPKSDLGDHVIAFNTRHIAMPGDEWRRRCYFHHTLYPGGASYTMAWELHEKDPTMVFWKAVYAEVGNNIFRHNSMTRFHCFPDEEIPKDLLENVTNQIPQMRPIPKRLDEHSEEEIDNFPKLTDWPKEYLIK